MRRRATARESSRPVPAAIDPAAIVSRAPEQLATEVADEIVLLGLRRSRYFGLEGVGADVWRRLETLLAGRTVRFAPAGDEDREAITMLEREIERRLGPRR